MRIDDDKRKIIVAHNFLGSASKRIKYRGYWTVIFRSSGVSFTIDSETLFTHNSFTRSDAWHTLEMNDR